MRTARTALILTAALLPGLAWAHTEAGGHFSLFTGFAHPFLGADHLLAMLMVGLWAAQQQGWQRALPPLVFVGFMALGSGLAYLGLTLPALETGIALSVLALGLFAAFAVRLPALVSLVVIAGFAVLHGHAHGIELPLASSAAYLPGYLAATALLHGIGYAFASRLVPAQGRIARAAGGATAVTGLAWLVG
ncbi:MAG: HupE/UreJ family protein [Pseudomonadota bacterium]